MSHDEKLPAELVWGEDGHASEIALTALGDAQSSILPDDVTAHVHGCAHCSELLGAAALLSLSMGDALSPLAVRDAETHESSAPSVARRLASLPLRAVAAAIALAGVGALPTLIQFPARLSEFSAGFTRTAPLFTKNVMLLVRGFAGQSGPLWLGLTLASVVILMMTAVGVTRALPVSREQVS